MKQRLIEQVGRTTRLRVLDELKRTPAGLPVRELAQKLGMSYMGVKDVCVDLERKGLLNTWRDPVGNGRPRLLYRITDRAQDLFPAASDDFTLELLRAAQKLFGASGAEKLLLVAFQQRAGGYGERVRGETLQEKAESLVRVREGEGHMSALECGPDGLYRIREYHSPIRDIFVAFPIAAKLEAEMFQRLLATPVHREETVISGQFCAIFTFGSSVQVTV